jgi:ketosteroid isomerase-like protein
MRGAAANLSMLKKLRTMLVLLLIQVIALGAFADPQRPGMPRAQKHESRHEIDQLEEVWRGAMLKGDVAALDALLADDYMGITASGTLQSKEQTLAFVRSGRVHFKTLEFSDRKVRFYGMTALVTSQADVTATNAEGDVSGSFRYIRVYVRDARGVWKIVSFEASRIRESGEHR